MPFQPLLTHETPVQLLPTLARKVGLVEAMVLQQLHTWLEFQPDRLSHGGHYWIHRPCSQWLKIFPFLSESTLRRVFAHLKKQGFILQRTIKNMRVYSIDYARLQAFLVEGPTDRNSVSDSSASSKNTIGELDGSTRIGRTLNLATPPGQNEQVIQSTWQASMVKMTGLSGQNDQANRSKWPVVPVNLNTSTGHFDRSLSAERIDNTFREVIINTLPPLSCSNHNSARGPAALEGRGTDGEAATNLVEGKGVERQEEEEDFKFNNSRLTAQQPEAREPEAQEPETREEQPAQPTGTQRHSGLFQEMVRIWNGIVQDKLPSGQKVTLTPTRQELLQAFLDTVFPEHLLVAGKLAAWENYCTLIANSRFLMGENGTGFKVTLDWALNPQKALKILEGGFYDKPKASSQIPSPDLPWEEFAEGLARTLPSSEYLLPWLNISLKLAKIIGQVKYKTWFLKVSLAEWTETAVTFAVEGKFQRDYIENHFYSQVRCVVQSLYPKVTRINFINRPSEMQAVSGQVACSKNDFVPGGIA